MVAYLVAWMVKSMVGEKAFEWAENLDNE